MPKINKKQYADKHRKERTFQVDDLVYLRLQRYKQTSLKRNGVENLNPRYYGPYKVIWKIGEVAHALELLEGSKIHNVFHVSCLKKTIGQQVFISDTLLLWMMKDNSHLFQKRFWRQGRQDWGAEQSKNTWCNGRIYQVKMPHGKRRIFCRIKILNCLKTSNIGWGGL